MVTAEGHPPSISQTCGRTWKNERGSKAADGMSDMLQFSPLLGKSLQRSILAGSAAAELISASMAMAGKVRSLYMLPRLDANM